MAIGTGTHYGAPLLGDDRAAGGLCEEMPVEVQTRRARNSAFFDFIDAGDFVSGTNWTVTQLAANGTATTQTGVTNGVVRLASAAVDADGLGSVQCNVASFLPSTTDTADGLANRIIAAEARFSITDWSNVNWFWGLAALDTTLMNATGALLAVGGDNFVGWHHIVDAQAQGGLTGPDGNDVRMASAGGGVANYQATLLSAAQVPLAAPTDVNIDSVFVQLGIKIIGTTQVEYYRNGALRHRRLMSNALAANLTPSFCHISNGVAISMDVDYVWAGQTRA